MNLTELLTSIANAIRTKKGTTASINAQDFPTEIASIPKGSGNATVGDVLSGKTFSNDNGAQTGTMTNRGAVSQTIAPGGSYTIPAGYHNGSGKVSASSLSLKQTAYTLGTAKRVNDNYTSYTVTNIPNYQSLSKVNFAIKSMSKIEGSGGAWTVNQDFIYSYTPSSGTLVIGTGYNNNVGTYATYAPKEIYVYTVG